MEGANLSEDRTVSLVWPRAGKLRVGHCTYLPPRLLAMIHRIGFDGSDGMRIKHLSGLTPTIVQGVISGVSNAGFGYLPVMHPDLLSYVLYNEPVVVCMPAGHILAIKSSIRPQDLKDESVITVARQLLPWMHKELEEFFAGFGITLQIEADAFAPPEAVAMTEHRIGVCLVGASAVSRCGVVGRPLVPQALSWKSGLFVRKENHHPRLQAFVDIVLNDFKNLR